MGVFQQEQRWLQTAAAKTQPAIEGDFFKIIHGDILSVKKMISFND